MMRFNLHHYYYPDEETAERLSRIENMLGVIKDNQEEIMSELDVKLAEIQDAQAATNDKLNVVKSDVEKLVAAAAIIPVPVPATLTDEQRSALGDILTHANAINDGLGAIDSTANPPAAPAA